MINPLFAQSTAHGGLPLAHAPTYTIFLHDFSATVTLHGETQGQPARFNLRLTVTHPGPAFPDDITAVMSYEPIVQDLRLLCADQRPTDMHDLAERAATLCLKQPKVCGVRVEVERLSLTAAFTQAR